jgi:hypothetical protein
MSDEESSRSDWLDEDEDEHLLSPSVDRSMSPLSPLLQESRNAEPGGAVVEELPSLRSAAPLAEELFTDQFFEEEDDGEPFTLPGVEKLGIIGGKGVGKSFLFQAMVYRSYAKSQAGAMSLFLEKARLFHALQRQDRANRLSLSEFGKNYTSWARLPQTLLSNQRWYRLRLHYRTGVLARVQSTLDVEFFDGSGEGFFEATRTHGISQLWRDSYLDARVMVFCLPLWVVFPGTRMSSDDWHLRRHVLQGFERVVQNYEELRREGKRKQPVKSIVALTMADDSRAALSTLYEKWIAPYMDSPHLFLPKLAKESGVARYLANARQVSEALHLELSASRDPRVSSISQVLDFGSGRPWMIPLSSVEGARLDRIERGLLPVDERPAPVPVHVELPLLVALCERHNALM